MADSIRLSLVITRDGDVRRHSVTREVDDGDNVPDVLSGLMADMVAHGDDYGRKLLLRFAKAADVYCDFADVERVRVAEVDDAEDAFANAARELVKAWAKFDSRRSGEPKE